MTSKSLRCAMTGLAGVVLVSCGTPSGLTRVEVAAADGRERALAGQILAEVNRYRESIGVAPLARHAGLDRLAQQHSEFLRGNAGKFGIHGKHVSHYGFEGRASAARNSMNLDNLAENVVYAQRPGGDAAAVLVRCWRNSPGHERNMRQRWGVTGIGVAIDDKGGVYATQLFGTRGTRQSAWAGPVRQF